MTSLTQKRMRCAVYTRKSTEEGLEREYNSIEAQRDGGQAYIASRRAEGWIPVGADYDDPAYSGGTMERPALKRLLADIEAGLIDIVVVYKIDRLTRSLHDFSRLVEIFDRHKVSFVSVTQQFNTTDSMGRLMLNVLLSFAQFEREVAADRVRDKMVASKKKGLWMHGVPPLGYDIKERRLAVNAAEAKIVTLIFQRFAATGSATGVVKELRERGIVSKHWVTQSGREIVGKAIDKSYLYKMLANRTYLGELRHQDQWFPGAHPAVIATDLWERAQAAFTRPPRAAVSEREGKVVFLLKGLVVGADGRALTPWHTTKKNGRRYRYYLSTRTLHEGAGTTDLPRLPASELEAAVIEQLRGVLRSPEMIAAMVPEAMKQDPDLDEARVTVAMRQLDALWDQLFPAEQARVVRLLVERVVVSADTLEVRLRAAGIESMKSELADDAGVAA